MKKCSLSSLLAELSREGLRAQRKLSSVRAVLEGGGGWRWALPPLAGAPHSAWSPYLETALCSRDDRPSRQRTGMDLPCTAEETENLTRQNSKLAHLVFLCSMLTRGSVNLLEEDSGRRREMVMSRGEERGGGGRGLTSLTDSRA